MTRDEAILLAHDIAHNWPDHAWPPTTVDWWAQQLQTLLHPAALEAWAAARRRFMDPPTWAQFMGCYRIVTAEPVTMDDGPQLDLDGHRLALAELRAAHRFLGRR